MNRKKQRSISVLFGVLTVLWLFSAVTRLKTLPLGLIGLSGLELLWHNRMSILADMKAAGVRVIRTGQRVFWIYEELVELVSMTGVKNGLLRLLYLRGKTCAGEIF